MIFLDCITELSLIPYCLLISHAIAGGFSPAMATALYTNVGTYAAGLIYVVFGVISVCGIYITFCCGGNQKEADTGEMPKSAVAAVEMKGSTQSSIGESTEKSIV